jgi:DNA polymerase III sliding clamp (beta) subunit (PCNA family)
MNMIEITISAETLRDALAGASVATSKDKTLPAFTCVKVTPTPSGLEFAATDRFILVSGEIVPDGEANTWQEFDTLLDADTVKRFIAALKDALKTHKHGLIVKLVLDGDTITLTGLGDGASVSSGVAYGGFPRYASLFPDTFSEIESICLNPELFARVAKIPMVKDGQNEFKFAGSVKPVTVVVPHVTVAWRVILMPLRKQS